jgi:hypothetical protein
MLKLEFKAIESCPRTKIDFYNNINRIPFSISIGEYSSLPSTIYSRNMHGENFIEFRFDKDKLNLYEISLVTIQNSSVIKTPSNPLPVFGNMEFYVCNICEEESLLEGCLPMEIERDNNSVHINLKANYSSIFKYFSIGNNCSLGVSSDFYLKSIYLHGINKEDIFDIFGY